MPENQTTAHETELQITSNGKSLDVDYTLEDLPLDFNIKGNTVVNVVWNLSENGMVSLNTIYGNQTLQGNSFRFKDNTGVTRGRHITLLTRKTVFEPNTTYTITYHIKKLQGANQIKCTAYGVDFELPREVGIHSFTFDTNHASFFTGNINFFDVYLNTKSSTDPVDEWDIEILNCVKGEIPYTTALKGVTSVGVETGIEIATQTERPILGEYTLQGDIPQQLDFIETKIEEHDSVYEITWI